MNDTNHSLGDISVVLPAMAPDAYLEAALRSLADQTLTPAEVLIVGPVKYHAHYASLAAQCCLPSVRLLADKGAGLAAALILAIGECRYELIARMDADDIAHPERLARQHEAMMADPKLAVCGTGIRLIDQSSRLMDIRGKGAGIQTLRSLDLLFQNPLVHPSVLMRRSLVAPTGFYRKDSIAEDYDLWLRCAGRGLRMALLGEVLLDYRVHDGQLSHAASGLLRARQIAGAVRESLGGQHPVGVWVATAVWVTRGVFVEVKKRLSAGGAR